MSGPRPHGDILSNQNEKMGSRMRALFELRTINDAIGRKYLIDSLKDKRNSTLLRHEVAFALGQMHENDILGDLIAILKDFDDDVVVRHECAEAIGAIGDKKGLSSLKECLEREGEHIEVTQTCELAIEKLMKEADDINDAFKTIDPVNRSVEEEKLSVEDLESILLNENENLGKRYRAMFTLRDLNTDKACLALAKGLFETSSALFRHEVAFVLGQLENPVAFEALKKSLENVNENEMVRHEAAEALGALDTQDVIPILTQYSKDKSQIVRESCEVALDAKQYWQDFETTSS